MQATGLQIGIPGSPVSVPLTQPVGPVAPMGSAQPLMQTPRPMNIGGVMNIASASAVLDAARKAAESKFQLEQMKPEIQGLAGHVKACFELAKRAKLTAETEMLEALQSRRGHYTADMMAQLRAQGGSAIYMMLMATKARGAGALMRDVLIGQGNDKPWNIGPTPVPDLPPDVEERIINQVADEVYMAAAVQGEQITDDLIRQRLSDVRDDTMYMLQQEAAKRAERMEKKMEDQLTEGGFLRAFSEFIDDLTTFKCAFLKGPVIRRKPKLTWQPGSMGNYTPTVTYELVLEWVRVDPFSMYPAPWAKTCDDGFLIEKHKLTRTSITSLIGVDGYSEDAIRKVLELYGTSGLHDWLSVESQKAFAEGRDQTGVTSADTIDALQFFGSVSGKMLIEWGMDKAKVPDPAKEYECEVWTIGPHVIKAALNPDPLCRRGYFKASYENIPGSFWGNSLFDLIRDCQDMCNAAARALANNLGIASGPQVGVNVDRLPTGANITSLYPWKIWQFTSDPIGNTTQPAVTFFNPDSHAQELMAVYEKFSVLADEYSGIPRYMTGADAIGGAGRTASGMSMMIGNAGKVIKQLLCTVDVDILIPMLDMLYYYNMRYGTDPDLKGDICVKAKGALSLQQKETAQVRRNEFLQVTNNPADLQIIGPEGRAYLLREAVKDLDVDADKVVPSIEAMRRRMVIQAAQAAVQNAQASAAQAAGAKPPGGTPAKTPPTQGSGQALTNGAPQTDNFQPMPA